MSTKSWVLFYQGKHAESLHRCHLCEQVRQQSAGSRICGCKPSVQVSCRTRQLQVTFCSLESLLKRQVNRNRRRLVGLLHFIKMVLRTPFSLRMTGLSDKWKSIGVSSTSTPSWAAIHTGDGHVCWMCREWERERAVSQQQTTGPKGWAHPQIGQKRVGPQAHTDIII